MYKYLTKGIVYSTSDARRGADFNLSLFIKQTLEDQGIIPSNDDCCFGKNVFINKGILGKGTVNLKKEIISILEFLGLSVSLDCCNREYSISTSHATNHKTQTSFSLVNEVKRILDFYNMAYSDVCCDGPPGYVILTLRNFLGESVNYPVGVFNVNGQLLGIADDANEYITIWNGDADNQAQGTLQATEISTVFKIEKTATITQLTGLNYWQITLDSANSTMYLSDDSYVELSNGTVVKSEDYPLGNPNAVFQYNTNITMPTGPVVICTDPFRAVPVTQGNIRVFHNNTGSYAAQSVFELWRDNFGMLPPTVKVISFYRIAQNLVSANLNPTNYTNFYEATKNVELFQINGSPFTWNSAYVAHMSKLKSFQWFANGFDATSRPFSMFGFNKTKHPDLKQIIIRYNLQPSFSPLTIADFANLAPLRWGIDINGSQAAVSSDLDNFFIGLSQSVTTPAIPNTRISHQQQVVARTSASDAAVAYLQSLGYLIL